MLGMSILLTTHKLIRILTLPYTNRTNGLDKRQETEPKERKEDIQKKNSRTDIQLHLFCFGEMKGTRTFRLRHTNYVT